MIIKERQSYDREFKQKAVELSFARGNARSYYTGGVESTNNTIKIVLRWLGIYQAWD